MQKEVVKEFDRLYLEKCKEVNALEHKTENLQARLEIAIKQKIEAEKRLKAKEEEMTRLTRELAAEPLRGFIPNVEPPEELPECLADDVPVWMLQNVSTQDILCMSSALRNLYEIDKEGAAYSKLSAAMDKLIDKYSSEV